MTYIEQCKEEIKNLKKQMQKISVEITQLEDSKSAALKIFNKSYERRARYGIAKYNVAFGDVYYYIETTFKEIEANFNGWYKVMECEKRRLELVVQSHGGVK